MTGREDGHEVALYSQPDHGENGRRRRRWDDEGAPDVEWDPVASPPARS